MKVFLRSLAVAVLGLLISGCASQKLDATRSPGVNLGDYKTFHVKRQPRDRRGIEVMISDRLNEMGYKSTYEGGSEPTGLEDVHVTYIDRWMWDITNYMLELRIQFRDPKTNSALASGRSMRTSLVRKEPQYMVNETLTEMFEEGSK